MGARGGDGRWGTRNGWEMRSRGGWEMGSRGGDQIIYSTCSYLKYKLLL